MIISVDLRGDINSPVFVERKKEIVTANKDLMYTCGVFRVATMAEFDSTSAWISHVRHPYFATACRDLSFSCCRGKNTCENPARSPACAEDVAYVCEKLVPSGMERSSQV